MESYIREFLLRKEDRRMSKTFSKAISAAITLERIYLLAIGVFNYKIESWTFAGKVVFVVLPVIGSIYILIQYVKERKGKKERELKGYHIIIYSLIPILLSGLVIVTPFA